LICLQSWVRIRSSILALAIIAVSTFNSCRRESTSVTLRSIDDARAAAQAKQKFLFVEFGANWCSDCLALSKALNEPSRRADLERSFDVLHVDVGEFNRNLDVARSLGININDGIPAAVFFPPTGSPVRKTGNRQILDFLESRPLLIR
jgi:thiol:disulfide interchange protein